MTPSIGLPYTKIIFLLVLLVILLFVILLNRRCTFLIAPLLLLLGYHQLRRRYRLRLSRRRWLRRSRRRRRRSLPHLPLPRLLNKHRLLPLHLLLHRPPLRQIRLSLPRLFLREPLSLFLLLEFLGFAEFDEFAEVALAEFGFAALALELEAGCFCLGCEGTGVGGGGGCCCYY